jgi:hypothetical protein
MKLPLDPVRSVRLRCFRRQDAMTRLLQRMQRVVTGSGRNRLAHGTIRTLLAEKSMHAILPITP